MALLTLSLALGLLASAAGQSDLDTSHYTCPTNYLPIVIPSFFTTPNVTCAPDPCYGTPGPCGQGGKCSIQALTVSRGATFFRTLCQCQKPAVEFDVGEYSPQVCYVNGTDSCNPNPCKNNATCRADPDAAAYYNCQCQDGWQGTTCELAYPSPPAKLKSGGAPSLSRGATLLVLLSSGLAMLTLLS